MDMAGQTRHRILSLLLERVERPVYVEEIEICFLDQAGGCDRMDVSVSNSGAGLHNSAETMKISDRVFAGLIPTERFQNSVWTYFKRLIFYF